MVSACGEWQQALTTACTDVGEQDGEYDVVPDKDKPKSYDVDSKSLTVQDIRRDMKNDVEHVVSIFGLDVSPIGFHL